ncbi:MAG TPA: hypothetical protein VEC12_10125 [Bacteroidia bacterium]|nr:hypothetical protein [Bacteroidia bacterium]
MNKKTVVLIVAFVGCLVPFTIKAQEIKVTKSPEILKGDELTVDFVIAGQAANNLYVYRRIEKGIELYKFDKTTLKLADKKEISFKLREDATKTRTPDLNKVLILKDHIIVFTDLYYKGDNESSLYARRFDFNLNPVKEWQKLEYINTEISAHPGMFLITASADSSRILIVKTETITNNKGNEKLSFTVINPKLSWMSSKDEELKYADTRTNVAGYKIANDGTVHLLVKVEEEKETVYKLCRFTLNNANEFVASEFDLKLPGKKTADITCEINNAGDLLVAGFYSAGSEKIQGIFSGWILNGSNAVFTPVYTDVAGLPDTRPIIDKLNIQHENAFELFAEERYQAAGAPAVYHQNAVHYFSMANAGSLNSYSTVLKSSKAEDISVNSFLSYFSYTGNNAPLLFFNEHRSNLEAENYKEFTATQKDNKRVLVYTTFDGDKITRVPLLKESDEGNGFMPRYAMQISPGEMLMLGKRHENYVLYIITIQSKEHLVSGH